ncbi:hypothetical protein VNI00_011620 [Paramarasmius palmivorus]|uniref:F-box domain-containing protein n=1 Tax=Paramarasmius palmivorus TaxID=297713 RepID=A0AAW0CC55_9AGAR
MSHSNRLIVEELLEDAKAELAELDDMLAVQTSTFLEGRRDDLGKMIDRFRSLLHPIRLIPPEILINIFSRFCAYHWLGGQHEDSESIPITSISSVCHLWRDIALSTPSLWSGIGIYVPGCNEQTLDHVQLLLDRSRIHPLRIWIAFENVDPLPPPAIRVLSHLFATSKRWQSLKLSEFPYPLMEDPTFDIIIGSLPLLKHLEIRDNNLDLDGEAYLCDLFKSCPSLVSLCIYYSPYVVWELPWTQVCNLEIPLMDILHFLPSCQAVQRVNLTVKDADDPAVEAPHACSDVQHLAAFVYEQCHASFLFENTTLRRLTSLEIENEYSGMQDYWSEWEQKPILDFLTRSKCMITSLFLKWIPITGEQTIQLLRLMPALTDLRLDEYWRAEIPNMNRIVTPAFLRTLEVQHGQNGGPLAPNLRKLRFGMHPEDDDALVEALESRCIANSMHASLGVQCTRKVDILFLDGEKSRIKEVASRLQWMNKLGALVCVLYKIASEEYEVEVVT